MLVHHTLDYHFATALNEGVSPGCDCLVGRIVVALKIHALLSAV
jgi:hypothetical protein